MKKFVISILILVMVLVPTTTVAFADSTNTSEYYKINSNDVEFFVVNPDSQTPEDVFVLPRTYYVKKLNSVNINYKGVQYIPVAYNGHNGYIKQQDNSHYSPATVNLNKLNDNTAYFKLKVSLKQKFENSSIVIPAGEKLDYFGTKLGMNDSVNYVFSYANNFVVIPANTTYFEDLAVFEVPEHTFPVDNNSTVKKDEDLQSPYNKLSTNILTIGIAVACIVMVIIVYKPRKKVTTRDDYDDDYYDNYKSRYNAKNR